MVTDEEIKLFHLKKEILVFYDFSFEEYGLTNALIEPEIMTSSYWNYLDIEYNECISKTLILEKDIDMLRNGSLVVIIAIITECLDLVSTDRDYLFHGEKIDSIRKLVKRYSPSNNNEQTLLDICLQGFRLLEEAKVVDDQYDHDELEAFIESGKWIKQTFIKEYYVKRLQE
jgi:hypothetical protein